MAALSELLRDCRCRVDPAEFQSHIIAVFRRHCRGLSLEEILVEPCSKAVPFCHLVRESIRDHSVPDRVILLTALNLRKQARLPLLARRIEDNGDF